MEANEELISHMGRIEMKAKGKSQFVLDQKFTSMLKIGAQLSIIVQSLESKVLSTNGLKV